MFLIATKSDEGERHYWRGGEIWDVHGPEAVRFNSEADAEATIDLFRSRGSLSPSAHVVSLGEVL